MELPLGGLGPGQLTEATATLPISWRGSAIIRSYLCIAPPGQHISAKATQPSVRAKQLSGSSGNAACFLLAEERLDVLHLMRPSARCGLLPTGSSLWYHWLQGLGALTCSPSPSHVQVTLCLGLIVPSWCR